ncbi:MULTISPECIES: hypothetical protein [unclassified Streptomyces]|uniref:hypothetical protein n=1 Tax=unclassified Streptomyces TaxID=2593676 RepID=UPI00080492BB|nr:MULTISPECIES: hypothetical protein [unclassified Streptomyces]MYR75127.1 hypothetical protein [Streptomyces sp. SID4925]SBU97998.1 hypothetical protein YUMDRAFT_05997 [Streptomyces sp. OspMP-M45]
MAIDPLIPYSPAGDLMPLREIYDLLKSTGHPATLRHIKTWIRKDDLLTVRGHRGSVHVSYSDILLAHRDAVLAGEI